jgi:hypothetical protein
MLAARAAFLIIAEHFTGGLRLPWRAAPADAGAAAALPARMSPSSKGFRRDETSGASSRRGSVALRCATVAASQTASRTEAPPARPRQRRRRQSVEMRAGEGQRTARTGRFLLRLRERPRIAVTSSSPKGCWDSVERATRRLGGANAAEAGEGEWGPHGNSRQYLHDELAECWQYLCPPERSMAMQRRVID